MKVNIVVLLLLLPLFTGIRATLLLTDRTRIIETLLYVVVISCKYTYEQNNVRPLCVRACVRIRYTGTVAA